MTEQTPIYQQILQVLAGEIESGKFKAGQKLPSEAALVRRFGASRITVGRAVRELQQRGMVERQAGSGTYIRGESREAGEILLFGLIIPDLGETEIFEPICQGIANAPETGNAGLLWPHTQAADSDSDAQALQLCEQCVAHRVSGAFFAPVECTARAKETNRRVLQMLEAAEIPVVLLDRRPDEGAGRRKCDLVGIDNRRAGVLATEHLAGLGARKTGFVMYEGQAPTAHLRAAGYAEVVAGAPRVFTLSADMPFELPKEARECDAFVCSNDRLAGRLMHALLAKKVRIPEDVRIVGIDDVNYASLLPVPLTTIHQPCREIGEPAMQVMRERLRKPRSPVRDTLLDCELVVRESCGAPN
jgi:GntR family transcriptional regulator of arabinose operon